MDIENDTSAWITLSVAMSSRDDPLSMPEVQQLCRLNAELVSQERTAAAIFRSRMDGKTAMAHGSILTQIVASSWLWVLGTYEVFRRAKNRGGPLATCESFVHLNQQISEIRIVLAKREARGNNSLRQTPGHVVQPGGSIGWEYRDRQAQKCTFFRAPFARKWLAASSQLKQKAQAGLADKQERQDS